MKKNLFVQIFKIWPAGRPLGEPPEATAGLAVKPAFAPSSVQVQNGFPKRASEKKAETIVFELMNHA